MDALSQVLKVVRLAGAIFIDAKFTAPWGYHSPQADSIASVLEPGAERVVIFHVVSEGRCVAQIPGHEPLELGEGDVILFPQGHGHLMASAPGQQPARSKRTIAEILRRRPARILAGGGGASTRLVCGYLACEERLAKLLLAGLPPMVKVSLRGSPSGDWLESSLRYALGEVRRPHPGGEGVLAKLAEVLFIEVLRQHLNRHEPERTGWLAGTRDRIVGAALGALHAQPARAWTLEDLAREAHTSRSVLAERFQQIMGSSPMQYLTQWRMLLAANLLCRSNAPLSRIAEDVGYQTDTAFSRAFRREYGVPPAAWRRTRQSGAVAAASA